MSNYYKIVRIPFNRAIMHSSNGMSMKLFREMLNLLPDDAHFIGCGMDVCSYVDYMYISSDRFKAIPEGSVIPDVIPYFIRNTDGTTSCTKIDFSHAIDANIPCKHSWVVQMGFTNSYEYCKLCNEKK